MTKALIAFIALLGLFISNKVFADTCHIGHPSVGIIQTYTASSCPVFYFGTTNFRASTSTNGWRSYISNVDGSSVWLLMIDDNNGDQGTRCSVFPSASNCPPPKPPVTSCPDGSEAPSGDSSKCSPETSTQRWCAVSVVGSDVCTSVTSTDLIGGCSSMCAAMGSSCASTDPANNVGSCANGSPIAFFGYQSSPIANTPPNAVQCTSSNCVTDAMNGITRTTNEDGSTTVTQKFPDGKTTATVTSPNGSEKVTTTTPDGTTSIVISSPDGSKSTSTTTPDGTNTSTTTNVDGSSSSLVTSPNGDTNATKTTTTGTTTNTTVINGTKTITIQAPPPVKPPAPPPPAPPPTSTGSNSTDLSPVVDRLDYLVNASRDAATQSQQQTDQAYYANQRLSELVSANGATLTALADVRNAVGANTTALNSLGSKVDGLGTSVDGIGQKIDQTNSKLDGIGDTLQGISEGLSGSEFSLPTVSDSDITDSLGLSNSPGVGSLYSPDVELTSVYSTFSGWLPDTQTCPTLPPTNLPWVGEFSWDFTLFCDLLAIFGVLVMAAAYISVPFIIFGGKK